MEKYKKNAKYSKSRDNRKGNRTKQTYKSESDEDVEYSYPYYLENEKSSDSKENESSSDSEEEEEQIIEIQNNNELAQSSYDDNFLNQNDFTNKEIAKYKESLIHDEDEVLERLERIYWK